MALETLLASDIPSPPGPLRLRRETEADDAFLFGLFCEARPELMLLPPAMRSTMLAQQFRAQATSYGARYPASLKAIVSLDGEAIGRLIVDETGGDLHLVDIAVSFGMRGKGLGSAILAALTGMGSPIRLYVSTANPGALKLYLAHGFRETARNDADIEMHWRGE
jgi:ribosomal protein S18 acetylase RimI-like enzyme